MPLIKETKLYLKLQRVYRLFRPENISLKIILYSRVKIETFTTEWLTSGRVLQTLNIHHLPLLQKTDTKISNLNSCLAIMF